MVGLEYFVSVFVPATIFIIVAFAGFVGFIASIYNRALENNVEKIENMMDAYYYDVKQFRREQEKKSGTRYVTAAEAAKIFNIFQQEKRCLLIGSTSQTKPSKRSSPPHFLPIRVGNSNFPPIFHPDLTLIGMEEVEITSPSTN